MHGRIRDAVVVVFILGGLAAAVLGYFWFSGRIESRKRQLVAVHFSGVAGLRRGDPVYVLGIEKGRVRDVRLEGSRVRVVVALDPDVVLTDNAQFGVRSMSYLGSDRYLLVNPGDGPPAAPGRVFNGRNEALDLEETFLRLDSLLAVLNPERLIIQLAALKDELGSMLRSQAGGLSGDVERVAEAVERLSTHLDSIVEPGSTAGRLASSSELYDELRQTNQQLKSLIEDIRANPDRYLKLRFSLFPQPRQRKN